MPELLHESLHIPIDLAEGCAPKARGDLGAVRLDRYYEDHNFPITKASGRSVRPDRKQEALLAERAIAGVLRVDGEHFNTAFTALAEAKACGVNLAPDYLFLEAVETRRIAGVIRSYLLWAEYVCRFRTSDNRPRDRIPFLAKWWREFDEAREKMRTYLEDAEGRRVPDCNGTDAAREGLRSRSTNAELRAREK